MKTLLSSIIFALLILFAGCNSNRSEKDIASVSDTTSITGLTGDAIKLVKTAGIDFKVKDVRQSVKDITQITHSVSGLITHQNIELTESQTRELKLSNDSLLVISSFKPAADVTARVPSQNLEEFMFSIADIGYFISGSKMDIDDKSFDYLSNHLKQQQRNKMLLKQESNHLKDSTMLQRINLNDQIIDRQIANKQIDADVIYSTVQLHLFQNPIVKKEVTVNANIDDYRLSFSKNLLNALSTGWEYFISFILVLANLWVFILISIAALIVVKKYKTRHKLS